MNTIFKLLLTSDVANFELWDYTVNLCSSLKKHMNIDILLVSTGGNPSERQLQQIKDLEIQADFTDHKLEWNDNFEHYQENTMEFENYLNFILRDFTPHLVHLNHYSCKNLSSNAPIIIAAHEDVLNRIKWVEKRGRNIPYEQKFLKYRKLIHENLNRANVVVTTSKFMAEGLLRLYDFNSYIKIIYNGINYEPIHETPLKTSIITHAKSCQKSSNLDLLSKVSYKVPNDIDIYVIGKNENYLKNNNRIKFLDNPSLEDLKAAYKSASIYLALSPWDVYGIIQTQAAYSNCAIIANDIPIARELWDDCACIFERNNHNSLIRNVNNLLENNNLLSVTAKKCQTKALSAFNSNRMGLEYINLYKGILQKTALKNKQNSK